MNTGNTVDCQNASNAPDGLTALIGYCQTCPAGSYGQYRGGFLIVQNPGNSTNITVVVLP